MRPGWKSSSASHFSPVPISLIGFAVTARMESAAPPRPSPSTRVSTMPLMPTRSLKLLASLTASWPVSAVGDQQRLVRLGDVAHLGRLAHQVVVDVRAPGGIEQHHVVAGELGRLQRAAGDLLRRLAGDDGQRIDLGLLAQHAQLLLRRRPAHVERGHQHFLLVAIGEPVADLGAGGGLARALQADQQDGDRRLRGKIDRLGVRAQHGDQLVVHDLDHHLARA